jgi:hypothetical protein
MFRRFASHRRERVCEHTLARLKFPIADGSGDTTMRQEDDIVTRRQRCLRPEGTFFPGGSVPYDLHIGLEASPASRVIGSQTLFLDFGCAVCCEANKRLIVSLQQRRVKRMDRGQLTMVEGCIATERRARWSREFSDGHQSSTDSDSHIRLSNVGRDHQFSDIPRDRSAAGTTSCNQYASLLNSCSILTYLCSSG